MEGSSFSRKPIVVKEGLTIGRDILNELEQVLCIGQILFGFSFGKTSSLKEKMNVKIRNLLESRAELKARIPNHGVKIAAHNTLLRACATWNSNRLKNFKKECESLYHIKDKKRNFNISEDEYIQCFKNTYYDAKLEKKLVLPFIKAQVDHVFTEKKEFLAQMNASTDRYEMAEDFKRLSGKYNKSVRTFDGKLAATKKNALLEELDKLVGPDLDFLASNTKATKIMEETPKKAEETKSSGKKGFPIEAATIASISTSSSKNGKETDFKSMSRDQAKELVKELRRQFPDSDPWEVEDDNNEPTLVRSTKKPRNSK